MQNAVDGVRARLPPAAMQQNAMEANPVMAEANRLLIISVLVNRIYWLMRFMKKS